MSRTTKRWSARICGALLAGLCLAGPGWAKAEGMSASESLKDILGGNETYRKNETLAKRREAIAQSQTPQAIILSCSDSRVPPEAVFNRYLGRLFVVRTAGHVVGDYELGSIEYAVEHLKVPLLVVMGHERCGAVKATVEAVKASGAEPAEGHGGGHGDADEGHGKHHRAERRGGQDDAAGFAGACAGKHKAAAHEDAEDAENAEDAEDAEDAGHGKKHGKAKGKAKGHKAKGGHDEEADEEAADDEGGEDADNGGHGKKAAKGHKAKGGHDEEDADEDADEESGHGKKHGKPAKAHKAKGGGHDEDADEEAGEEAHGEAHGDAHGKAPAKAEHAPEAAHGEGGHDHIGSLVEALRPAVLEAMGNTPQDLVDEAVRVNTLRVAHELPERSGVIKEAVQKGQLKIVGARYDLDTGAVDLLE